MIVGTPDFDRGLPKLLILTKYSLDILFLRDFEECRAFDVVVRHG